jgi:arginyl-tRNA synthetase
MSDMQDVLKQAITDVLKELGIVGADFVVEHPKDLSHGDYSTNAAMVAAKVAGKNPREVAEALRVKLEGNIEYVETIEIAGPGFINFILVRDFFLGEVSRVQDLGDEWGKNESWKGKRVVVEYTDPNPFKEFHVGHLFTNAVGESIARLFMMAGADTKRVNYQGDIGLHVACAVWGLQQLGAAANESPTAHELGRAYTHGASAYKDNDKAKEAIKVINKALYEKSDEVLNALYEKGRAASLEYFENIYKTLGTEFDEYFYESEAGPKGKELVLAYPEIFPESDGARVFKGEEHGLHTRVFLNAEGLPTYEAKELALAKIKDERLGGYDHSVVSTSNEINEYFKVLLKAMSFVYPELAAKTEHIGHGTVRLATGKMSSRTGDVIAATDFIGEIALAAKDRIEATSPELAADDTLSTDVAIAAIKFVTLRGSILQDSIFDKERALSFEGDSGPYLQYTHARIISVLKKAMDRGVLPNTSHAPKTPYEVERILYRFPEAVEEALEERAPHIVTGYLIELAGAFNTFYAAERIADGTDEFAPYKAAVSDAVRVTLKNGLWVLGIKAPLRM